MMKDTLERAREPNLDVRSYLSSAYVHPVFKDEDEEADHSTDDEKDNDGILVPTKRQSRRNTPMPSKYGHSSSPSHPDAVQDQL